MSSYLSQPNPVTARWEGEDHLRDPKFQLDAFRVSIPSMMIILVNLPPNLSAISKYPMYLFSELIYPALSFNGGKPICP
jgi:hypothetical protein